MAERVESGNEGEVTDESKARKRKPNFSVNEIFVITENVKNHLAVIQSKLTNNITNPKNNEIWQEITDAVNAVGTAGRTVAEVKDKWKNLHSTAKKEFATFRRETKKTGGGPGLKPPSASSEKIIEVFKDTPAFRGLNGFEAGSEAATPSENASTISCDFDREVEDGEVAVVKERKRRKVSCSQDDVQLY
ncbi:t-SNARE domain-containing protein 1-like [Montipora foliosa]|uniref:t-SNARE domain-containing protein 1-like n=1 Tax=Montipora foliosa TaxID=591990 RepID=UPI0035F20A14